MLKKTGYIYNKYSGVLLPMLGVTLVSIIVLPYLILGEGSYVVVHDQMDGEILNYIYQAEYLFAGSVIPEFMNGMPKSAMLPPAPLMVLLYKIFEPFTAFALMHWICLLIGFGGFWLLCRKMLIKKEIGCAVACIFSYMPLYPVYGLAIWGQPLLIYCFWNLLERPEAQKSKWDLAKYLLGITLYAATSSLVLVGYVWVVLGFVCMVILLMMKKKYEAIRACVGTGVLTIVYLLANLDLLRGFVGETAVTHRQEMKLVATENLLERGKELLLNGGAYAPVYSCIIIAAGVLLMIYTYYIYIYIYIRI